MPEKRPGEGAGPVDTAGRAVGLVIRRIREAGPIPFAEFMEIALYAPGAGYYTSGRQTWGPKGDYITSIDVSPAFARALARQVIEFWELLGSPASFGLVEAGAGRGWLSLGMLEHISRESPVMYKGLTAHLVDPGGPPEGLPEKAVWHSGLAEIATMEAACVFSNELVDAFPTHRVEFTDGALKELYVDFDGEAFKEVPGPLSDPALGEYFHWNAVEPFEGMKAEVNLEAGRWMRKAAALFKRGFVLTIDYGVPARELYSPERKGGSLHCHFRHTLNDNPFANMGEQDMTAHVDFTALALASKEAGLGITGFTTQKNFLLGLGILEELREPASLGADGVGEVNFNRAIGALIAPGGMGDIFKVLIGHKGVEKPRIKGLSFKDMTRSLCLP